VGYTSADILPGVQEEIGTIQRVFSSPRIHADPPAKSEELLTASDLPSVLHVSCHGAYEASAPLLSRLLLADRPVFAFEIVLAGLTVDLAVLSSCQTAEGAMQTGGYVQSIASSFLKSGAATAVAASWPVDDRASSAFTNLFYDQLLEGDKAPVAALNVTQRLLRRQPGFEHPYFWAPFVAFSVY